MLYLSPVQCDALYCSRQSHKLALDLVLLLGYNGPIHNCLTQDPPYDMRAAVALRFASMQGGKHANSGARYNPNLSPRYIVGARGHHLVSQHA